MSKMRLILVAVAIVPMFAADAQTGVEYDGKSVRIRGRLGATDEGARF